MRKTFVALILVALIASVTAQISVIDVEQYKTKVGWRLYFRTNNPFMWPMADFNRWELVLSDERLGYHPPYIGAMVTASDQNYTDPEFTLFSPLPAGMYYYRLMLYSDYGASGETDQLTFTLGTIEPYQYIVPYVCDYAPFHTAIALESKEQADILVEVYDEANVAFGNIYPTNGLRFIWLDDMTSAPTFTGSLKFSSMTPFRYTVMIMNGNVSAISYTGGTQ